MANNRLNIVETIAGEFPELFRQAQLNTHENCAMFLWRVCNRLAEEFPLERWGLLTKNHGENGFTWPNNIRTSHDAICLPNGERIDIVGSAGDTTKIASPRWGVVPPEHWRPHNVWIDYLEVMMGGNRPPPVDEGLAKALRQVDENNRFLRKVADIWDIPFP